MLKNMKIMLDICAKTLYNISCTAKTDDDFEDGKHLIYKGFGNFEGDCPVSKNWAFLCKCE